VGNVFLLLSFLAVLKLLVEEGERSSWWLRGVHALLYGSFVLALHPIALTINKMWVDETLNTIKWLNDVTLFVMLDMVLSFLAMTSHDVRWPSHARFRYYGLLQLVFDSLHKVAYFLPPLLIFPALFYFRVELLFLLTGYSFIGVTVTLALAVMLLVLLAPYISRFLSLTRETALLLGFVTFLLVITAMLFTPEGLVHGVAQGDLPKELLHSGLLLVAFAIIALVGYGLRRILRHS
jgi:hypothetical protein